MQNPALAMAWTYVQMAWHRARATATDDDGGGATLENVGWYIAAGLGVVVIAAILWAAIKEKASEPLPAPKAP